MKGKHFRIMGRFFIKDPKTQIHAPLAKATWRPLRKSVRKSMVHSRRASAWSSMVEEGWAAEGEGQNDWAEDRPPDRPDQGKMPLPILLPQNNGRLVHEWLGSFKTKILFLSFQMLLIQTATPDRSREENKQSVHEDTRSPLPPSPYPPFILPPTHHRTPSLYPSTSPFHSNPTIHPISLMGEDLGGEGGETCSHKLLKNIVRHSCM